MSAVVSIPSVSSRLLAGAISDPTVTFRLDVWETSDDLSSGMVTEMAPCSTYLCVGMASSLLEQTPH